MKKLIQGILVGSTLLFGLWLGGMSQSASAATIHTGTPTAIRGWWRTKMTKETYYIGNEKHHIWDYQTLQITKKHVWGMNEDGKTFKIRNVAYQVSKYHGIKVYTLLGTHTKHRKQVFAADYDRIGDILLSVDIDVKKQSIGKPVTWYPFSGRISRTTLYPY